MLTSAQAATLKAAMLADPAVIALVATGNDNAIAAYYNAVPPAPVTVWRPSIPVPELNTAIDWSTYGGLSQGQRDTYRDMIASGTIDATSANVRSGFVAAFGGASATVAALTTLAQVSATRFQALFTVNGVTSAFGRVITVADLVQARA